MDKVTQSNAASAEESAAVAQELNSQAAGLKNAVAELQKLIGNKSVTGGDVPVSPDTNRLPVPAEAGLQVASAKVAVPSRPAGVAAFD